MKPFFKVLAVGVLISLSALFILDNNSDLGSVTAEEKKEVHKPSDRPTLRQMVEGRGEHEFLYTHDPKTMTVPRERLSEAFAYTESLLNREGPIPNVTWEERGPNNVSGRTRSILIDAADATGNTLFSGGVGGGIWKTTDGGDTWLAINDFYKNIAIGDITQEPNNPSTIYFGTGEGYGNFDQIRGLGIWKSTDGGTSFTQLPSTDNNGNFFTVNSMVAVHTAGTTSVIAGTGSGVFRSTNGGTTWTNVRGGTSCKDITVSRDGDIYAGMDNDGIYKSTDDGATWTEVYNNGGGEGRQELSAAPSDNNVIYAVIEGTTPTIRRTSNGGGTWTLLTQPQWVDQNCGSTSPDFTRTQDWYDLTVAVDPNNPDRAFIGGVDLFGTTNGGTTWTQVSSWASACGRQFVHADQHALVFQPGSSDILWNGNDGGLFRTANATATIPTFEFKGEGYNITQFYACDLDPDEGVDYFLAGAQDNGTQRFQGAGLVNTSSASGGDGGFCHIDQNDGGQTQITSFTRNNFNISTNGGVSFSAGPRLNTGQFINPTDYDDNAGILYAASGTGNFLRWNNPRTGGNSTDVVTVNEIGGTATHVKTSPNVNNRVYIGTSSRVVRVDGANTGTSLSGTTIFPSQGGTISCVEIEVGNEDHIIVTLSNFGVASVWESTNANSGSPTWTNIENNLPDMPVRWALFNPNNSDQVLLATELGVWSTDNLNGASTDWQPTNANLANTRVDMLQSRSSDKLVIAGTHGRGLFSTDAFNERLFFTKTAVSQANSNDIITYELEVFNNKSTAVTNVTITDVLDAGLDYVDGSATCGSVAGNTLTINQASLAAGATLTCTFQARLGINNFTTVSFEDDMESGEGNWSVDNIQGAGTWNNGTTNPRSPTHAWFTPNTGAADNNTAALVLDPMTIATNSELAFYHNYNTEANWDGGFVEISVGGGPWADLGPNFIENGYNSVLGVNANTNINGRAAFSGNSGGYILSRINLSSFSGSNAQIRFVFGEDDNTGVEGWYIDDVSVIQSYSVPNMACVTTSQGDNLCASVSTLVFECETACPTCDDGILNGDEEEIDCGGFDCAACPTCDDGIMNQGETEVDCGGPNCPACPTCSDGIMNQGETGIDCGGPNCTPCDCNDVADVVYDNVTLADGTLTRAKTSITNTDVTVGTATGARLLAGNRIDVNAELTVATGGELELTIDDCIEVPGVLEKEKEQEKKQ